MMQVNMISVTLMKLFWALRQIGKRNSRLNQMAINAVARIHGIDSKSSKWIASDALRELTSAAVQARLGKGKA